ncbi:MAG TPA: MBL fold metallo-hydrolase [Gemmatimonadaceae bacterium]|jgi:ribonuclease Z|nr:MBL fold metallo-hydrolase [Gemmatimonadaceae bacterium]
MSRAVLGAVSAVFLVSLGFAACAATPTAAPASSRTRVIMLGTGNPFADPDRFGPATVIVVDNTAYLVDCGVGVVRRWAAAIRDGETGFRPWDLRRVFITHLHSDHTLGYAELILTSWTLEGGQLGAQQVYGPRGLRSMTDHLLAAYARDIGIRTGPGGDLEGAPPPNVEVHEIEPGVIYRDSLVTVTAFAVHHGTWPQAFGYRFQTPDKDIVLSGDAAPPTTIPEQCHGCDILIHEGGFFHRNGAGAYRLSFHTSMEDLVDVARAARPKLLVLYHRPPWGNEEGLNFIRSHYDGQVVVAKDLDVFR